MRRVLYFNYQPIHTCPPCLAEVCTLADMGIEVTVLTTGCNEPTAKLLESKGVTCHFFRQIHFPVMLIQRAVNAVNYFCVFHRWFRKYWTDHAAIWTGTEESLLKMWRFLRNHRPIIANALEFYEDDHYQTSMKRIATQADILTACEPHRAQFMADWWGLEKVPYVLRNKPYGWIPPKGDGSTPELKAGIDLMRGKKVVLYQGSIESDRDLSHLARALNRADSDYYLVLSGLDKQNSVEALKKIYPRVIYLGNYPAPTHLEITPYATCAVAFYKDNCINNRYCAPNKIYEYAGCGVPMLCNPIPGLTETVGKAGAGECVDFTDPDAVIAALERIHANYDAYHRAALEFYRQTDNAPVMKQIVEDAFSRTKAAKE